MNTEQYIILTVCSIVMLALGYIYGKYSMVNYVIKTLSSLLSVSLGIPFEVDDKEDNK